MTAKSEKSEKSEQPTAEQTEQPAEQPAEQPEQPDQPADQGEQVPEGTVQEVTDWVGDDPDRARQALDAENESDSPRTTLVAALEKITDGDGDGDEEADSSTS